MSWRIVIVSSHADRLNKELISCESDVAQPIDNVALSMAMNGSEARLYVSWKRDQLEHYCIPRSEASAPGLLQDSQQNAFQIFKMDFLGEATGTGTTFQQNKDSDSPLVISFNFLL